MTEADDLHARLLVARGAPWAFLTVKTVFVAVTIVSMLRGDFNELAAVLAFTMLPVVIISFISASLVNRLLADGEATARQRHPISTRR